MSRQEEGNSSLLDCVPRVGPVVSACRLLLLLQWSGSPRASSPKRRYNLEIKCMLKRFLGTFS